MKLLIKFDNFMESCPKVKLVQHYFIKKL